MKLDIKTYILINKLRDLLKKTQQTSWNISQFERKFPFELMSEDEEKPTLEAYITYALDIQDLSKMITNLKDNADEEVKAVWKKVENSRRLQK